MKLRELIASTRNVKADGTWNPNKDFRTKSFGAIIDIDVKGKYNSQYKTLTVFMTINSSTQHTRAISTVRGNDVISTHSVAITFKNIEQIVFPIEEIINKMNVYNMSNSSGITLNTVQDFINLQQKEHPELVPIKVTDTVVILRTKVTMSTECRVRCTCAHYYYTFAYYNAAAGVHIGEAPANYNSRRKKQFKWTSRNKGGNPGLCKHLQLLISYIMKPDNGINGDIEYVNKSLKVNKKDEERYNTESGAKGRWSQAGKVISNFKTGKEPAQSATKEQANKDFKEYLKAVKEQKAENSSSMNNSSEINDRKFSNEGY